MSLPTGASPQQSESVGIADGVSSRGGGAALDSHALVTHVEFMRFCPHCNEDTRFIAQIEMLHGLYGCCANCGDESLAPFTRTVGDAA
jgi:hypothetical protein